MIPTNPKFSLEEADLQAQIDTGHLINVAAVVQCTEAEGPGKRMALWVQGCPFRCIGCCNPHMLAFQPRQLQTTQDVIQKTLSTEGIEGITLLGGEPFAQAVGLARLAQAAQEHGLSVMVFTGYTLRSLQQAKRPAWDALLAHTDLLIDGPYLPAQHSHKRRWIGSDNQQIHFLSPHYAHLRDEQAGWPAANNTIEIRLHNGQISINGFPHQDLTRLLLQPTGK
ncbi:radical SAM protein [Myxococcota bacterium]|nr:radical SAM protein [Myxococcota bacterium]